VSCKGAVLSGPVSRSPLTIQEHRLLRDGYSTKENFMALVHKDERQIIKLQEQGFAFISGGQLNWLDLLRPIASSFRGFQKRSSKGEDSIGPVTRWYSTNTFYRKPTITGKIECDGTELSEFLPELKRKGIVFLLGPYSFVRLCQNSYYKDTKDVVLDYAEAIAKNIKALKEKGYNAILFSEPSFAFDLLRNAFNERLWIKAFAEKIKREDFVLGVNFPLADSSKFLHLIDETEFDFVGIDAVYSDFTKIKTEKDILLGVIDGSRIGIESSQKIKELIKEFKSHATFSGDYYIGTNDRLSDVPFEQGLKKIELLSITSQELMKNE
jgi:methionine synthase II (cobalamin-independent)